MSGLINKIKEAVHSDKADNQATDNPNSSNAGPHGSNAMNKADPRVDSDRDNLHSHGTTGTSGIGSHGTTGTSGIGSHGTTGTSGIGSTGAGYGSTNAGPHSSNIANSADPRVDSDRDGRGIGHGPTGTSGGIGNTTGAGYGSTGTSGIGGTHGSTNAGPHSSNIANRADPRVDSDRDGRGIGHGPTGTSGGIGNTTGAGGYGNTGSSGIGSTGAGYGSTGTSGIGGTHGSTNAGPHSSNMANKADPRVDSDRDGRGIGHGSAGNAGGIGSTGAGYGSTGTSGIGGTHGSTNAGPHSSNMANKADPRVDSDLDGGRSTGFGTSGTGHGDRSGYNQGSSGLGSSATPGSGDAAKTAGPHNSDLLNKLDPRVDSDMDGSKTMGGNATHK